MNPLDIYAQVESNFGFDDEVRNLQNYYMEQIDNNNDDDKELFLTVDTVFDDRILYNTMNSFVKNSSEFRREKGTIKQYHHSYEVIEKYSKMRVTKIEFFLYTDEMEDQNDKNIYVLEN